eukprot:8419993-Ditylum_brightwellii.AAC.1
MSQLATTNAQLQQQVYELQQQMNVQAGQMMMLAMTNNQQHRNRKPKNNNTPTGQQCQPPMPMPQPAQFGYIPSGVQQAQPWTSQQHGIHPQQYPQQNIQRLQQGGQQNKWHVQCAMPGAYVECHMAESDEWVAQRMPQSMGGSSTRADQQTTPPPDVAAATESAAPGHAIHQPAMVLTPRGNRE